MKPSKYDETATTKTPETPKTRVENCYPTKQKKSEIDCVTTKRFLAIDTYRKLYC